MKILLVNNFYYNRGGDCTYLFLLKKLLERKGHKVVVFSMHHPQNSDSEYSKYFVSYINYKEEIENKNILSGFKVLNRTIYSREAKEKIERLIREEKPDVAHLQNIHHHATPSILYALKKYKIPIVWTLHYYTLICPNTSFLSHGRICEKCKKRKYFWAPIVRCKKGSFSASLMAVIETIIHRVMKINNLVDVFIAPSKFLMDKFIEYGFKEKKIVWLRHFIEIPQDSKEETGENYYLYVGRLSEEKGVKTLIDAAIKVCSNDDNISDRVSTSKLKIVGSGPLEKELLLYAKNKDRDNMIGFLGHRSHDEVIKLIRNCQFVVVPSEWYEIYSFVILESFACGKPVIGSRIGGITKLIKDAKGGIVVEPGDVEGLASAIKYLLNNLDIAAEMGKNAEEFARHTLNPEEHYGKLIEIYKQAINKKNRE